MRPLDLLLKPIRIALLTLAFLLALLIGFVDYLLETEGGSESLMKLLQQAYPAFTVSEVSGTVLTGLSARQVQLKPWLQAEQLTVKLNGRCLARFSLCIETLTAAKVMVQLPQNGRAGETVELPRIALPILLDLESVQFKQLVIRRADAEQRIDNFFLRAQAALPQLNILSARAAYNGFVASLKGDVELQGDYPLSATADIAHPASNTLIQLKADQSVALLRLKADIRQRGKLHLNANVQPLLQRIPIVLTATSEGAFHYALPETDLQLEQLTLEAKGMLDALHMQAQLQLAGSAIPPTRMNLDALLEGQRVRVENVLFQTLGGEVGIQGQLDFTDALRWQADWQLRSIQTQQFWPTLQSQLSGQGSSNGELNGKQHNFAVNFQQLDGTWRNYKVQANGSIGREGALWRANELQLSLGRNTIKLNGSLNRDWHMDGLVQAPELHAFWPGLAGELNGRFSVTGEPAKPTVEAKIDARKFSYASLRVNKASLNASIIQLAEQGSQLALRLEGLEVAGQAAGQLDLAASGARQNHVANLTLNGPTTAFNGRLEGKWNGKGWDASLREANILIKSSVMAQWSLAQAVPMTWRSKSGLKVDPFCWRHASASLCSQESLLVGPKGKLVLELRGMEAAWLEAYFPDGFAWQAQLGLRAQLAWDPNTTTQADFAFTSTPGQFQLTQANKPPLVFPYRQLMLTSQLKQSLLVNRLILESDTLGQLDANVNVSAKPATDRSLDGTVRLSGLQLSLFKPFYEKLTRLEGALSADGRIAGTVSSPQFLGTINLQNGKANAENLPLPIDNFNFSAKLNGLSADLAGEFTSGKGTASLRGNLAWADDLRGQLNLTGEGLKLTPTRGLKMTVKPDLTAELQETGIKVTGKVAVTDGSLTTKALPVGAIEESADTVMVGEQPESRSGLKMSTDILVSIADNFAFNGFGAEGNLTGELRVTQAPVQEMPRGDGEIRLVDGKYTIYGQRLSVRTGRVLFNGPMDLPTLQVEAIRTIDQQVVGIRIFGRVDQPNSTLFSEPSLPEDTALSYLVTGRPPSAGSTTQSNNYMGQAAVALGVMGGEGIARDVAEKIGVSDFSLSSDTTVEGKQLVSVAGYISPKLYVRYGMGVFEPGNTVTLRYSVTPRLYLEAINGLQSALDLIYTFDIGKKPVAPTSP